MGESLKKPGEGVGRCTMVGTTGPTIRPGANPFFCPVMYDSDNQFSSSFSHLFSAIFFSLIASIMVAKEERFFHTLKGGERVCLTGLRSLTLSSRFSRPLSMYCLQHNGHTGSWRTGRVTIPPVIRGQV